MKTVISPNEDDWYSGPTHPFALIVNDDDAGHGHPTEPLSGHGFPATRRQLVALRAQIDRVLKRG